MKAHGTFTIVTLGQEYPLSNNIFSYVYFVSNFKYKITEIQPSEERKEKAPYPGTF